MSSVEEVCDHFALINHAQVVLSGRVMDVRRQFRTGLYEVVTVGGTLAPDPTYDIVSVEEQYDEHRYVLRKRLTAAIPTGCRCSRARPRCGSLPSSCPP